MTQVGICIDIIEYLPADFNFENFTFIFTSEGKDFEKEISYLNKNQICHKTTVGKKNIKYSVKATKNASLIGLGELVIPSSVLIKKESIFDKTCSINMTDSVKRVLFGNTSGSNNLKLNIHFTLQYIEKEEKTKTSIKTSIATSSSKKEDKGKSCTPKASTNKGKQIKLTGNTNQNFNPNKDSVKKTIQKKLTSDFKRQRESSKPKVHTITSPVINMKLKAQQISKEKETYGKEIKDPEEDPNDLSVMDEELNKPLAKVGEDFTEYINTFSRNNPVEKLNDFTDVQEALKYTKNIIDQLLDYQLKYYDLLKNSVDTHHKFNELLTKYTEKYRYIIKKMNRLNDEKNKNDMKKDMVVNIHRTDNNNLKQIIPLKKKELDLYKNMYSIHLDEEEVKNYSTEKMKHLEEKKVNDDKTQTLLIKVLSNVAARFGPLGKILTKSNSTEPERNNLKCVANKFNLPYNDTSSKQNTDNNVESKENEINNDNIEKFEFVSTNKPDDIDQKLEKYLKYFYSQRKFPKIIFKKTSPNNYEYGSQKVMIKIEGDAIRVRYVGGYLLLDKFIETNSHVEESKKKIANQKASSTNSAKKRKNETKKK